MIVNIDETAELLLNRAVSFAQSLGNPDVDTQHVLYAYMTCVGHQDLEQDGLTAGKVVDAIWRGTQNVVSWELTSPQANAKLLEILQKLDNEASELETVATVDNIMYAILEDGSNKASDIVLNITFKLPEMILERLTPLARAG